jgi:hypothetical protein
MAKKIPGLKISKSEVSQTINFKRDFGVDISKNEGLKNRIGQAIIDRIRERTLNNESVHGGGFEEYSEEYVNSDDFKIYGKSKGDINLKLTGDMLSSIDVESTDGNKVKVGVIETQTPKAYNHHKGDTVPPRPWFGVNEDDIKDIKRRFENELRNIKREKENQEERERQTKIDLATLRALSRKSSEQRITENNALQASLFNDFLKERDGIINPSFLNRESRLFGDLFEFPEDDNG